LINLPRKVRGSGNVFLEKPTPKGYGFRKCLFKKTYPERFGVHEKIFLEKNTTPKPFRFTNSFFGKHLLPTLPPPPNSPPSVPHFSIHIRICRLLPRHFLYVTLPLLHFRGTKNHGNMAAWGVGFALAAILAY
jgi:hypothetical protein